MKKKPFNLEVFAEQIAKRIGPRKEFDTEYWSGEHLMLGGYKGLEPKSIYSVRVPVFDKKDHKAEIIKAWNQRRGPGVERYVSKYFSPEKVKQIMEFL